MANFIWNIKSLKLITKSEADAWMSALSLPFGSRWEYGGGIRFEGQSYNDVDVNVWVPQATPCLCRNYFTSLPSAPFPVQIMCKTCGASMSYSPSSDAWTYTWNEKEAEFVKAFPADMRGVDFKMIKDAFDRIKALEGKSKVK